MDSLQNLFTLINAQTATAVIAFGVMTWASAKLYTVTRKSSTAFLTIGMALLFLARALPVTALFFWPPIYDRATGVSYPEISGFAVWLCLPLEIAGSVISAISLSTFSLSLSKRLAQQGIQPDGPASGGSAS